MNKVLDFHLLQKQTLNRRLTEGNVDRAKKCSYIMIIIEILMILRSYFINGDLFNIYICMYYLLIFVAVLFLFLLHKTKNIEKECERIKNQNTLLYIFYSFFLFWGLTISLLDQMSYGHVTAFLTNLITTSILFITPKKKYLWLHVPPAITLFVGLFIVQQNMSIFIGHIINVLIFYIFVIFGATLIYNMFKKMIYQEVELSEKNKQLAVWSEKMENLAIIDDLTQIHNRRGLYELVEKHIQLNKRNMTVLVIDIDEFKKYNDFYGHIPGDEVLYTVAQTIQRIVKRQEFEVARYGGEEFIVVAYNLSQAEMAHLAESLRSAIEELQLLHEKSTVADYITLSIGCAQGIINNMPDFDQLVMDADDALYKVKHSTRNAIAVSQIIDPIY